jgi:hypothetical protein
MQRLRSFGDVYLAWTLWRLLGLDDLLSRQMPAGREDVPWATVAAILCIARFCRPSSELFIENHLHQRLGQLFELSYDLLLYDLTSTYFEG